MALTGTAAAQTSVESTTPSKPKASKEVERGRYIVSLGPAGSPAPAYVPPGQEPKPPFIQFPAPPK